MTDMANWAGKKLGLRASGAGSLAKVPRRVIALAVDWGIALMVSGAFFAGDNTATLSIFMVEQWLLVATIGSSFGHMLVRIRVQRLGATHVGLVSSLIRIGLILLVIPAVIWDNDNRGLHDKAAKTVLVLH